MDEFVEDANLFTLIVVLPVYLTIIMVYYISNCSEISFHIVSFFLCLSINSIWFTCIPHHQPPVTRKISRRETRSRHPGLTQQKRQEIKEAFELFDTDGSGTEVFLSQYIFVCVCFKVSVLGLLLTWYFLFN